MHNCSNCGGKAAGEEVLRVTYRGLVITTLCGTCVKPAAKPRITLTRKSEKDVFTYEQYVCIEPLEVPREGF